MDAPASRADLDALVRQLPFRVLHGQACEWEGVDVLHFAHGQPKRKQTYSRARLPLARRSAPVR